MDPCLLCHLLPPTAGRLKCLAENFRLPPVSDPIVTSVLAPKSPSPASSPRAVCFECPPYYSLSTAASTKTRA
ncbi:hypothetical protein SprV_0200757500 [Sparganum proliferum]